MTDIRVTQAAIETLTSVSFSPTARLSRMSLEVAASFTDFSPVARVTRMSLEVLTTSPTPPPITTPVVRRFTAQQTNGSLATINLDYPLQIEADDLLLAAVTHRGDAALNTPAGWTLEFSTPIFSGSDQQTSVYTQVATGSESGTVAFTSSDTGRKNGYMFSIANCTGIGAHAVDVTTNNVATVVPTWSGQTLYTYDWVLANSSSETVSATGITTDFGISTATGQMRMWAAFAETGETSEVTHLSSGDGTEAIAIELLGSAVGSASRRVTFSINYT